MGMELQWPKMTLLAWFDEGGYDIIEYLALALAPTKAKVFWLIFKYWRRPPWGNDYVRGFDVEGGLKKKRPGK